VMNPTPNLDGPNEAPRSHTTVFLKRPGCVNVATEDVPNSFRWLIAGVRLSERADVVYH
jgi:hypothetical protein